jgi:hypothetical protein
MATAKKYRAFARECMGWADRARTVEHRETLLDMATCWAEVAARLDHQHALLGQFDDLVRKAKWHFPGSRRAAAMDGNGLSHQMNGSSAQAEHADGVSLANQLPRESDETSSE